MSDGRRFEDKVSINDFMNMPEKELLANIYIQTLKTNGTVRDHEGRIDDIEKEYANKDDIKAFCIDVKEQLKEKMDWGMFKRLSIILGILISALTIPSLILNILKYIQLMP